MISAPSAGSDLLISEAQVAAESGLIGASGSTSPALVPFGELVDKAMSASAPATPLPVPPGGSSTPRLVEGETEDSTEGETTLFKEDADSAPEDIDPDKAELPRTSHGGTPAQAGTKGSSQITTSRAESNGPHPTLPLSSSEPASKSAGAAHGTAVSRPNRGAAKAAVGDAADEVTEFPATGSPRDDVPVPGVQRATASPASPSDTPPGSAFTTPTPLEAAEPANALPVDAPVAAPSSTADATVTTPSTPTGARGAKSRRHATASNELAAASPVTDTSSSASGATGAIGGQQGDIGGKGTSDPVSRLAGSGSSPTATAVVNTASGRDVEHSPDPARFEARTVSTLPPGSKAGAPEGSPAASPVTGTSSSASGATGAIGGQQGDIRGKGTSGPVSRLAGSGSSPTATAVVDTASGRNLEHSPDPARFEARTASTLPSGSKAGAPEAAQSMHVDLPETVETGPSTIPAAIKVPAGESSLHVPAGRSSEVIQGRQPQASVGDATNARSPLVQSARAVPTEPNEASAANVSMGNIGRSDAVETTSRAGSLRPDVQIEVLAKNPAPITSHAARAMGSKVASEEPASGPEVAASKVPAGTIQNQAVSESSVRTGTRRAIEGAEQGTRDEVSVNRESRASSEPRSDRGQGVVRSAREFEKTRPLAESQQAQGSAERPSRGAPREALLTSATPATLFRSAEAVPTAQSVRSGVSRDLTTSAGIVTQAGFDGSRAEAPSPRNDRSFVRMARGDQSAQAEADVLDGKTLQTGSRTMSDAPPAKSDERDNASSTPQEHGRSQERRSASAESDSARLPEAQPDAGAKLPGQGSPASNPVKPSPENPAQKVAEGEGVAGERPGRVETREPAPVGKVPKRAETRSSRGPNEWVRPLLDALSARFAGGMRGADSDDAMTGTRSPRQSSVSPAQKLPASRIAVAESGAPDASPVRNTSRADIFSDHQTDSNWTVEQPEAPRSEELSAAPTAEDGIRGRDRMERIEGLLVRESAALRKSDTHGFSVVLRPDADTELRVHLQQRAGQIEATIQCDRGDLATLTMHWDRLREALAGHEIRLLPLNDNSPTTPSSESSFQLSTRNGSGSAEDRNSRQAPAFMSEQEPSSRHRTHVRAEARTSTTTFPMPTRSQPRGDRWETWA